MNNQSTRTSYPLPAEIIRTIAVLLGIKSESKAANKKLDAACLDLFLDVYEANKLIKEHLVQPVRKKVSTSLASKIQEALDDYIGKYYKIVADNQPSVTRTDTLHMLIHAFFTDLLKLIRTCLPEGSPQIDKLILGKPTGNKNITLELDGFKNSSAIAVVMNYLKINNAWMERKKLSDNDKRMFYKWKSADGANPSLYSLTQIFDKDSNEIEIMFIARAIDEFRRSYYELFDHLVYFILKGKQKEVQVSDEDYSVNKVYEQINVIFSELVAPSKNAGVQKHIKSKLDLLFADKCVNHYQQVQAQLHRVSAMYHLFNGEKEDALKEIKRAINKWLFNNQLNNNLLELALNIGAIQDSPDKAFLKNIYKALVNFGIKEPINHMEDKRNKYSDHIQEWQIKDWQKLPHPDLLFEGIQPYDIETSMPTAPVIMTDKKLDYRSIDQNIKIGDSNINKVTYTPLIYYVVMQDYQEVKRLLSQRADINRLSSSKDSAINVALFSLSPTATGVSCRKTAKEIVDLLLSEPYRSQHTKETINTRTAKKKYAPLHSAIDAGEPDYVEALLEMGADVNMKATTNEQSPLHYLINTLNTVKMGTELFHLKMSNFTPKTVAEKDSWHRYGNDLFSSHIEDNLNISKIMKSLTQNFYKKTQETINLEKVIRIAELLLQNGADPNQKHKNPHVPLKGYTPFMFSVENDEIELFKLMLQHDGDIRQTCNYRGREISLIFIAQYCKSNKVLQLLKSKEVEI